MIKTYILDDEQPAVESIKTLLHLHEDFASAEIQYNTNPKVAIEEINTFCPDILFLDIEMPFYNGFEVLQQIDTEKLIVIFVTAYDQYAIQAIKENALDYILKPIDPVQFKTALEKASQRLNKKNYSAGAIQKLIQSNEKRKIAIASKNGYVLIAPEEILYVVAENVYSVFHLTNGKNITQSKNLKTTASMLPERLFLRISRSCIIKCDAIVGFTFHNGGTISLTDGSEHSIGKTYRKLVFEFLKKQFFFDV